MVFVAPKLTAEQASVVICGAWVAARGKKRKFLAIMASLMKNHCFRLLERSPKINFSNHFDPTLDDSTARVRYNFTIAELQCLSVKLQPTVRTPEGDVVSSFEALAMVCRRLAEPSKLFTVANEFGRSTAAYSRICKETIAILHHLHSRRLYFASSMVADRVDQYCDAVFRKGGLLRSCWVFIDGTKQYIARPSARGNPSSPYENLQRSVYNGHPRRHCLNWQAVTTPDGILASVYGPVEGRRHDSTMLIMSGLLKVLEQDGNFEGKLIYDDPAYGTEDYLCSPFALAAPKSREATFNRCMSRVRESVEWSFGRVKGLWAFVNWDKKMKVR